MSSLSACILQVENTIRWRTLKDEEGNDLKDEFDNPMRESNARVVRWSDGRYLQYTCIYNSEIHENTGIFLKRKIVIICL